MKKALVEFQPHAGFPNHPTYAVYHSVITNHAARCIAYSIVDKTEHETATIFIRRFVEGSLANWRVGRRVFMLDMIAEIASRVIVHGLTGVSWDDVFTRLSTSNNPNDRTLEYIAACVLGQVEWTAALDMDDVDCALMSFVIDLAMQWVEKRDVRTQEGPLARMADAVLFSYFQAVDWSFLVSTMREASE
ncbi:hypothetical protein [Ktedonospora formicarum]|uniref:Uncharacterized protein n=1 Tax=Ktedonospora formicarum TaxID=2778364 RepID=A0A8J3I1J3_9CHLR|nr:hypothetical protein [Ktedonospora formicarum]GHO44542.1 hypothetical protein KSX_27050 [Ktedonospora formicarum]